MRNGQIDYLKGIKENDFSILNKIYNDFGPSIVNYIKKNSGTLEDAKDVLQEGLMVIYKKLNENNLELSSTFEAYLYGVCRFVWLNKLKKKSKKEVTNQGFDTLTIEQQLLEDKLIESRRRILFQKKFEELTEECKTVLQLSFNGNSGKEIAALTGYAEDYVKRKKYKCKEKLVRLIKADSEYSVLTQQ